MAARFADHPEAVAETGRLADTLAFDLTSDLGYRYPGAEDDGRRPPPGRDVRRALRRPLPARQPAPRARPSSGWRPSCGSSPGSACRASSTSTTSCSSSRARSPCEVRGPSVARQVLPPGRGRGSSVSSIVCYLTGLSHVDPVKNDLLLGRFLNEEITSLPDIDLDFPRDVREVLLPRIHERYGRERSALVAAFPTYKPRGAIRELGKALGLPPGEIERVARGVGGVGRRRRRATSTSRSATGKRVDPPAAVGLARRAVADEAHGPAAPPQPALGRDDRRDAAARRLLPGRAGGDDRPADGPLGQGLVLGRGLPEDRPARARDALGGRALRRPHRRGARGRRSTSRGSRTTTRRRSRRSRRPTRPASSRSRAARRWRRCGARGPRRSRRSRSRWRSCGRGRSRAARSTRTSSGASGCARTRVRGALRAPVARAGAARRRSARSSSRTRSSRSRWRSRASRRARPRGCAGR